jgi:hypothetical protein
MSTKNQRNEETNPLKRNETRKFAKRKSLGKEMTQSELNLDGIFEKHKKSSSLKSPKNEFIRSPKFKNDLDYALLLETFSKSSFPLIQIPTQEECTTFRQCFNSYMDCDESSKLFKLNPTSPTYKHHPACMTNIRLLSDDHRSYVLNADKLKLFITTKMPDIPAVLIDIVLEYFNIGYYLHFHPDRTENNQNAQMEIIEEKIEEEMKHEEELKECEQETKQELKEKGCETQKKNEVKQEVKEVEKYCPSTRVDLLLHDLVITFKLTTDFHMTLLYFTSYLLFRFEIQAENLGAEDNLFSHYNKKMKSTQYWDTLCIAKPNGKEKKQKLEEQKIGPSLNESKKKFGSTIFYARVDFLHCATKSKRKQEKIKRNKSYAPVQDTTENDLLTFSQNNSVVLIFFSFKTSVAFFLHLHARRNKQMVVVANHLCHGSELSECRALDRWLSPLNRTFLSFNTTGGYCEWSSSRPYSSAENVRKDLNDIGDWLVKYNFKTIRAGREILKPEFSFMDVQRKMIDILTVNRGTMTGSL